jgi:hypothetical protein
VLAGLGTALRYLTGLPCVSQGSGAGVASRA